MRIALGLLLLTACGGDVVSGSDASDDGSQTKDAPSFACGMTTCGGDQFCVHPCCGGAPPPCVAETDAGTCPPGTTMTGYCSTQTMCTPIPCTPPPPYCAPSCFTPSGHDCYEACK